MAQIIDGKQIAADVRRTLAGEVAALAAAGQVPGLAVILVGEDPASQTYVRNKQRACAEVGIRSVQIDLPADTTQERLLDTIRLLNARQDIHGILCQLPLPPHLDPHAVIAAIDPKKDVDAFHAENVGLISLGRPRFLPCTPAGVMELLHRSGVRMTGSRAVVIGRSDIVGKPMAMLLLHEDATVTVCHSRTQGLAEICRQADILIAAVGRARFVTADMVKPGATVIDVGMDRDESGRLCGDVDFAAVSDIAGRITPVPGGVGPMTIAMLLKNTVSAARAASRPQPAGDMPGRYRHYKGNEYELIGTARHSETLEPMAVYRALYGEGGLWVRPAAMWSEPVEHDGVTEPRFARIGDRA